MNWFLLALIATVSFALMNLIIRKLGNDGVKNEVLVFYLFGFGTLIALGYLLFSKASFNVGNFSLIFLFLVALFSIIGNILLVKSINIAPNPGYSLAILNVQVLIVAIASIFLFKSEFTLIKGVGAVFTILGVILLGL